MTMRSRVLVLPIALSLACAQPSVTPQGQENVITEEEIVESHALTAYDAIQKLRGNFLSNRGKTTILGTASPLPVVYLDGVQYGTYEQLRNIPASHVFSIRLYRAWESEKFGSDKTGGVIEIVTKLE